MCRVASIFKYGDTNINPDHIGEMLKRMEYLGRDATGLAFVSRKENIVWYTKAPGKASDFITEDFLDRIRKYTEESDVILLHTRAATHGAPSNNDNNHPILGKQYVMVHNGVVTLKEKFDAIGSTDTEQLLLAIEKYGLKKGPEKASGSAAVIFANCINKEYAYFYRALVSDLVLYRDKENKFVYLASTENIIRGAVENAKTITLKPNILYRYNILDGTINHYKELNLSRGPIKYRSINLNTSKVYTYPKLKENKHNKVNEALYWQSDYVDRYMEEDTTYDAFVAYAEYEGV